MENKINIARFKEGSRTAEAKDIWQWDYGQILRIQGLNLPSAVEIHFSLDEHGGEAARRIGVTKDGVTDVPIPDLMVENESAYGDSYYFFAYVYLTDETSGNTEYKIRAKVSTRSKPEAFNKPGDEELFRQAIDAVGKSADRAEDAEKSAEAWAHGREDYPDLVDDNAAYYAASAHDSMIETQHLAERVHSDADATARNAALAEQYKSQAAQSAADALQSEQNAKASETAAQEARAGAETAEGQAELFAAQAEEDKNTVEQGKAVVMEIGQKVEDNKKTVEQTVDNFKLLHEQAAADVNNAGQAQTERVNKSGETAVDNIEFSSKQAVQYVANEGATQVANVQAAAEEITGKVKQIEQNTQGISELKNNLTTKANQSDLDRTNSYLDALFKLNKGQTYDVLEQENEAYSVDVPSGSKFMGVDMVGGKSIIFNQLIDTSDIPTQTINGITFTNNGDGSITANGTATADINLIIQDDVPIVNSTILMSGCPSGGSGGTYRQRIVDKNMNGITSDNGDGIIDRGYANSRMPYKFAVFVGNRTTVSDLVFKPQLFDLTKQFGYTSRPLISNVISKYEEMGIDIVNHLHPYINGVASSQTDRVDVVSADGTISRQIETDFPALNSAGSVYDYIDLTEGKLYTWTYIEGNEVKALTEPVITDIEIHAELSDWLMVETGGSITFHNADDGKRLLIPNKLSFVRKLDEVTV